MAWIGGQPATGEEAVTAAARFIGASRLPVVTGRAGDVSTIRAMIALAEMSGGAVDHAGSRDIYPAIAALRDNGMILGAPGEIRRRADRFFVVGPDAFTGAPELAAFLFGGVRDLGPGAANGTREIIWLGAPEPLPALPNTMSVQCVDCPADGIGNAVGMLRAAVNGRPFGQGPLSAEKIRELAGWLTGAQFGCTVFSGRGLDALDIEMLAGLVSDLNAGTRFCTLPVHGERGAYGAALVSTWAMGFPLRAGFGRGFPDHDVHLFDAERLVVAGEADLAIYVAGPDQEEPDWSGAVPVIALTSGGAWMHPPRVAFEIGAAGRDHSGAVLDDRFGGFVPVEASAPSDRPSASRVLHAIAARLGCARHDERAA